MVVYVGGENVGYLVPGQSAWSRYCLPYCVHTSRPTTGIYRDDGMVELISSVSFLARPGELTGILGPSGCGKTTLLHLISGRQRSGIMTGTIKFNGQSEIDLRGILNVCYSKDALLPYLTLRETLMFAANLRLSGSVSMIEKNCRIDHLLDDLSLTKAQHTRIGDVNNKGLSSGELRRTTIAVELISDPSVLLLDEPTSGLDSVLALEIVQLLSSIARSSNKTIIMAIHQPRIHIFNLLDSIWLMSRGALLYSGPTSSIQKFVESALKIRIDEQRSLPEFLIDIASNVVEDGGVEIRKNREQCSNLAQVFKESTLHLNLLADISETAKGKKAPERFHQQGRNRFVQYLVEISTLTKRSFKNTVRNPLNFGILLLIQVIVGLLLGGIFRNLPLKYLPKSAPPSITDPESTVSRVLNQPIINFLAYGMDKNGYNPILELYTNGPDGNKTHGAGGDGNKTHGAGGDVFHRVLLSESRSDDFITCLHKSLELRDHQNWSEGDKSILHSFSKIKKYLQAAEEVVYGPNWELNFLAANYSLTRVPRMYTNIMGLLTCDGPTFDVLSKLSNCAGVWKVPSRAEQLSSALCEANKPFQMEYVRNYQARNQLHVYTPTSSTTPKPADLQKRSLQAASVISGGLFDTADFVPEVGKKALMKIMEYWKALKFCSHALCNEINRLDFTIGGDLLDYLSIIGAIMNVAGALFFAIANIGFSSYDALVCFSQERPIINRETANKMYRPSTYVIGKMIADLPFQCAGCILLSTIFYYLVGFNIASSSNFVFSKFLGISMVVSFTSYGFSYMISAAARTMEIAVVSAPIILVILLAASGFFVRDSAIPAAMVWIKYLSFYRWGFFALCLNQFPPHGYFWGIPNNLSLAIIGISETKVGVCLAWLAGLSILFRAITIFLLKNFHTSCGIENL